MARGKRKNHTGRRFTIRGVCYAKHEDLFGSFGADLCGLLLQLAQDPGGPRKLVKPGGTVLVYQPQVDDWQNFTDIKWRAAFQLTPNGGKQIVGAASFEATTEVNTDNQTVLLFNINVTNTYFEWEWRLD